jgi:activator of 2-hydroxyglutaryl-CoA dehydratase
MITAGIDIGSTTTKAVLLFRQIPREKSFVCALRNPV